MAAPRLLLLGLGSLCGVSARKLLVTQQDPILTPAAKHAIKVAKNKNNSNVARTCYTANVTTWEWCSGYEDTSMSCADVGTSDEYCSVYGCVDTCDWCENAYKGAVLDPTSGRCCDSISEDTGECVGPKDGTAPPNPDYGFPDHKPALIFEGAAGFANGYPVYSEDNLGGAVGWTSNSPGGYATDDACPALPDGYGIDPSLYPISYAAHGTPLDSCALACNKTAIENGAPDPCTGAFSDNNAGSPYACFSGGDTWLGDSSLGVCGFPCLIYNEDTGGECTWEEYQNPSGPCIVSCDPREYPGTGNKEEEEKSGAHKFRDTLGGSTCTGTGEFCCGAPGGDIENCPSSARTDDCDAKNDCCWG